MIATLILTMAATAMQTAAPAPVETPVLARTIERGDLLSAGDFTVEERTSAQGRGALAAADAAGMEASRRLTAGAVVRSGDLITPRLVRRGEPVVIHIRSGALTITASGRALANGGMGDMVRVVASTNRTLDGVVEGNGVVRISAP